MGSILSFKLSRHLKVTLSVKSSSSVTESFHLCISYLYMQACYPFCVIQIYVSVVCKWKTFWRRETKELVEEEGMRKNRGVGVGEKGER